MLQTPENSSYKLQKFKLQTPNSLSYRLQKIYCKLQTPENLSYRLQTKEVRDFTEILFKLTYGHGGSLTVGVPQGFKKSNLQ